MKFFIAASLVLFTASSYCQSFSINTDGSTADASSILEVKSTTKGILIPRMTKAQRNAIASPLKGLLVFINDADSLGFHYYSGTAWVWLEALAKAGWKTTGNAGTDTASNFIGTADAMPVRFKQNNQWLGQFNLNNGTYFIGKDAGKNNTAIGSIAFGDSALAKNTGSIQNTAFGYKALKENITGQQNTAIGYNALSVNNSGGFGFNTAVGSSSLAKSLVGTGSTAVGALTLMNDSSIGLNTAVGYRSLQQNTLGYCNVSMGTSAMLSNKMGTFNVAIGNNAMMNADKGLGNVAVGSDALKVDTSDFNTAIGILALALNTAGTENVAVGAYSLQANITGTRNTGLGAYSLFSNTTGSHGIAIGDSAGFKNTTASSNIFIGHAAGLSNQTRTNLLFIGDSSGYTNNAGSDMVFIGNNAGKNHKINSRNTFIGVEAGYSDSLGFNNTFLGHQAGYNNKGTAASTGIDNTFIGQQAGYTNTSGNLITVLGYNSDVLSAGLSNATAIGANAAVNQSNSLVLGSINGVNGATSNTLVGIGTTAPDYALHVVGSRTNDGGWADGIVIENTGTTGEAAISFRNTTVPSNRQWTVGMNQTTYLAFSYGGSFAGSVTRVAIDTFGNVGIGTTAPDAKLHVNTGNVLFNGDATIPGTPDDPPATGQGVRMMWYPGKAAFRAGAVSVDDWDKNNIGNYSFASGFNTRASGIFSAAMGNGSTASGSNSMAFGNISTSSGINSFSTGFFTSASGQNAVAMGNATLAIGTQSFAIGQSTIAALNNAVAMGQSTTALSINTVAMGMSTTAAGLYSFSSGLGTYANDVGSFVTGQYNDTTSRSSYNRIFGVGNGTSAAARSNALTVLYSGETGIGTSTPVATLDVSGDFKLGVNGTALISIIKATVFKDVASIAANDAVTETFSVSNAPLNSTVYISPSAALPDGVVISYARVSATGTVEVKFANITGAALNPNGLNYFITVIR